jgi:steroid 5-alpha reductase family enzyme
LYFYEMLMWTLFYLIAMQQYMILWTKNKFLIDSKEMLLLMHATYCFFFEMIENSIGFTSLHL